MSSGNPTGRAWREQSYALAAASCAREKFMHRRHFLRALPFAATAISGVKLASAAEGFPVGEPKMKRFEEQRWALDNIIQANGIDWDRGTRVYYCAPAGLKCLTTWWPCASV